MPATTATPGRGTERSGAARRHRSMPPFAWVARRRRLAVLLVGLFAFTASAGLMLAIGVPQAQIHDEFSYLLAADTFTHGRLTNPTHPLWVHFESFHIIHVPTYASKYPPGQGLVLAVGQVLTGQPIIGVWLCSALACIALLWILRAFLPPCWAFLGALLALFHPTLIEWSQCYWGGSLALLGGALVAGAVRRLVSADQVSSANTPRINREKNGPSISVRDSLWLGL